MKKQQIIFVWLLIPFTVAAQKTERAEWKKAFIAINQDVQYRGKAYESLQTATEKIGHRLTGTPNARKAEDFVLQAWRSYQLPEVKFMPFEVEAWSRSRVTLSFAPAQSDNFRDVEVVALAHSPVSAHLTAEVIDCGDGLATDFTKVGDRLKGKVALFNINIQLEENKGQKNLHRSEKTALAIQHGASGVIIANSVAGGVLLTGTASVTGELIPIPAVCISLESGRALRKWMKDEPPILAILDMQNFSRPIRARNVVATIPGTSRKHRKETIVIGGHLDSWDLAVGAMDNGVGSFSVLDIARVFQSAGLRSKRTIEFVLFMGEEQGLLGSKHMVQKYAQDKKLERIKLMMNLDMVNNVRGFNAMGNDQLKSFFDEIGPLIQEIDSTYGNANSNRAGLHSDHQPFMLKGIPTASPMGTFPVKAYNCYHANCDRLDLIDRQHMQNNVRYTAMMLFALANVDKFPEKVKTPEQTKEYLINQGLKQELIIGKDWPFGD